MSEYTRGTFIHGIAASEHLDSSGERILISGMDISSLDKEGVFNFEHQSKETSHIVGKVLEAKKIFNESDCENDNHRHFWNKIRMPFIYVAGELFDGVGHKAAQDVAAMLKYDKTISDENVRKTVNFSIEGSKLQTDGGIVKKCIARKVSITILPCNKICEAEMYDPSKPSAPTKQSIFNDLFKKSEPTEVEVLSKQERKYFPALKEKKAKVSPKAAFKPTPKEVAGGITGQATREVRAPKEFKPKKTVQAGSVGPSEKLMPGTRIQYRKKGKMRSGASIYSDPDTWKSEASNMHKKIMKSCGAAPSARVGTDALQVEDIKKELVKNMCDEYFKNFKESDKLLKFLQDKLPKLSKKEIVALAKTYVYVTTKEKEKHLESLVQNEGMDT